MVTLPAMVTLPWPCTVCLIVKEYLAGIGIAGSSGALLACSPRATVTGLSLHYGGTS